MSSKSYQEVNMALATRHTLTVDGENYTEEIKTTTISQSDSDKVSKIELQIRSIGSKSVTLVKADSCNEDEIETDLSEEELKDFNAKWNKNWRPTMTKDELLKVMASQNDSN